MEEKDFLSISNLSGDEIQALLSDTAGSKDRGWSAPLERKILAILFEKPSAKTCVTFEVAMGQLAGQAIFVSPAEVGLGKREAVSDAARVFVSYVDAITARTFSHPIPETLADYSGLPVINTLSDREHPPPAHRREKISEDDLDSPQSVVIDQAENRLHAQKTLPAEILGGREMPLVGYR